MESFKIIFIIPAYNEEKTISDVVSSLKSYGQILIVDDGSTDQTAHIAKKNGAIVRKHKKNYGYDSALNTGFETADILGFDYVITLDADLQHDTIVIPEFINQLVHKNAGIVAGVRLKSQRISELIFKKISKLIWGLQDPLCGLKGYNMEIYRKYGFFDTFNSIGTELLIRSANKKIKIKQIIVQTRKRFDKPRFGNVIFSNYKILRALLICLIKFR